jgi:hypothetical protein
MYYERVQNVDDLYGRIVRAAECIINERLAIPTRN